MGKCDILDICNRARLDTTPADRLSKPEEVQDVQGESTNEAHEKTQEIWMVPINDLDLRTTFCLKASEVKRMF